MKKYMKTAIGLIMSLMFLFAFAGCGGGSASTPADDAAAALDSTLAALKSADVNAIKELGGGEDVFGDAEEAFGSEEDLQTVLTAMLGNFDYKLGTPEQVDDSNVNIPVTVSNTDMNKAVNTWFSDLMAYAMANPDIANDEKALHSKTIELLTAAVDKTAAEDDGTVTQDVTIPMTLTDGKWDISDTVDDSVIDAILGGMVSAISSLTGEGGADASQ